MSAEERATSSGAAIVVRGLVKRYGELVAVDGIGFEVQRGSCLGLLGPNGAGKTTTIEILEGLTRPDAGEIEVLGLRWKENARAIRERIGVQLQETVLSGKLTVRETLALFRSFYARSREIDEVLALVGLEEKHRAKLDALSGGQRQRLSLGCALIGAPEVLFLDEPTTGLDPQARRRLWEIIEEFKRGGGTVLLTTHYMEEAERLADDLVILDNGKILARGSPAEIVASLQAEHIVELRFPEDGGALAVPIELLRGIEGVLSVKSEGNGLWLSVRRTQESVGLLLAALEREHVVLADLRTHRPTLEDVFVSLTGKHLRDA